jgi:hypothetical protein
MVCRQFTTRLGALRKLDRGPLAAVGRPVRIAGAAVGRDGVLFAARPVGPC